jgi:thiamine biosynthesis lipoprotein
MGTAVAIYVADGTGSHPAAAEAMAHLRRVEATFSTSIPDSQISRIADGRLAVENADPEVRAVLYECDRLRAVTDGAFNHMGGGKLDPAGYVKGWAVDGAAAILHDAGLSNFMIWAGGDVLVAGHSRDAESWSIGIRDPQDANRVVERVDIADGAVATSGRYERGDHIRGSGATGLASVSVVGPRLGIADALATAVFSAGLGDIGWWTEFPAYDLIAVADDRDVLRTSPRLSLGEATR